VEDRRAPATNRRPGDRTFDNPLELPDVARPVVGEQRVARGRRQRQRPERAMAIEKIPRELDDVVAALAQRRDLHVDPVQPVEEIQPKPALLHKVAQRPVRRDDDAGIDGAGAAPAHTLDREILYRPKQLGLRGRRQVRHLVEKERALVRVLELPAPPADAGRRPFLDAEQLRFQQRFDDSRAVDGDERSFAPPAALVNLTRDELLARAGLPFVKRLVEDRVSSWTCRQITLGRAGAGAAVDDPEARGVGGPARAEDAASALALDRQVALDGCGLAYLAPAMDSRPGRARRLSPGLGRCSELTAKGRQHVPESFTNIGKADLLNAVDVRELLGALL
jgi:hypothetical protein